MAEFDLLKNIAMNNLNMTSGSPTLQQSSSVTDAPPALNPGRTMMLNTIMKDLLNPEQGSGDKKGGLLNPLITAQKIKVATQFQQQEQDVTNKRNAYAQGIFNEAKAVAEDKSLTIPQKQEKLAAIGLKAEGNGFPEINKTLSNMTTLLNKELDIQNKQNQFVAKLTSDYSTTDDAKNFLQKNGVPITAFFSTTTNPITGQPMVSKKEVMGIYNEAMAKKYFRENKNDKINSQIVLTKMRGIDGIERTIENFKLKNSPTPDDMKQWINQLVSQGQGIQEAFQFVSGGVTESGFLGFGGGNPYTLDMLFTTPELAVLRAQEISAENENFRNVRASIPKLNVYQLGGTPAIEAPLQEPGKPIITVPKVTGQATAAETKKTPPKDKYVIGKTYTDAKGGKAKYLGDGKWERQ